MRALLALLGILAATAAPAPGDAWAAGSGSPDRLVLEMSSPGGATWTLKGRVKQAQLLALGTTFLPGRLLCFDDGTDTCPGRRAPVALQVRELGRFEAVAHFRRGRTCRFEGSLATPPVPGRFACTDAAGTEVLGGEFVLGVCRCTQGSPPASFCGLRPCPF